MMAKNCGGRVGFPPPQNYWRNVAYCFRRKNRFPLSGALVTLLLTMAPRYLPHVGVARLALVCSVQPVTDGGHDTMA